MSFCLCRWGRMALILFFLMVPACGPASAAYHFLGIGNDGYINDVNGLWGRMNLWANWSAQPAANNRIRENLSGGSILEELDALAGRLAPGDLGLFFYSGHMYSYAADDNGDETATGSAALNPYEERMGLRGNPWDRASDDAIAAALSGNGRRRHPGCGGGRLPRRRPDRRQRRSPDRGQPLFHGRGPRR